MPPESGRSVASHIGGDRPAQRLAFALVMSGVVVADQLSKWWGWRHVRGASVDTGGGVVNEVLAGVANELMRDPVGGAVADVGLCAVLVWLAYRLLARPRRRPVLIACSILLAAGTSNLLDRFGLHLVTAPHSARGVVNWIELGGGSTSPMNLADLLTLAAGIGLATILLMRSLRARVRSIPRRGVFVATGLTLLLVSLAGAFHSGTGVRTHPITSPAGTGQHGIGALDIPPSSALAAAARLERGTPTTAISSDQHPDDIRWIATQGTLVTVAWDAETVTVTGETVLGWRTDGVSTLYLRVLVTGPQTVVLYLPPPQSAVLCHWIQTTTGPSGPAVWECNPGTSTLDLANAPTTFP